MKKLITYIIGAILALSIGAYLLMVGKPVAPTGEDKKPAEIYKDLISITYPRPGDLITSPLIVKGEARGNWYFEATFPMVLTDWDGKIIAQWYAEAQLDPNDPESTWMTTEFVPFEGKLEFENPSWDADFSKNGYLIIQKSNASGLPEHDDSVEIPVRFE